MSLESLLLRCPACGTVFRAPVRLPDHGQVRCGVCQEIFAAQVGPSVEPSPEISVKSGVPRPAYVSAPAAPLPSMAGGLLRFGLLVLLMLGLAGQLAWLARNRLAEVPSLRPWLATACERLDCRLPAYHDLQTIRLTEARVTSHPDYGSALLAVVTLYNDAPLAQPWPRLALALTAPEEVAVAERIFEPAEFLPAERQGEVLFASGATVEVRLPLADPGTAAAGFKFSLY